MHGHARTCAGVRVATSRVPMPEPKRPKTVPAEATYDAANEQWELGKRNAKGKPEGEWRYWWRTTGHLCAVSQFSKNGTVEDYERYHPDGTISKKATEKNGKVSGPVIFQKSSKPTTELVLTEPLYANPEVFRCTIEGIERGFGINWRYYNKRGVRIDLDGDPLMTNADLKKNLDGREPPAALVELLEFQNLWTMGEFASGFAIVQEDKSAFKTWSKNKKFLSALLPIATANGTGSVYAFWLDGSSKDLAKVPVVIFGDEGGYFVVAENLRGLLAILAADAEPSVYPPVDDPGHVSFMERGKSRHAGRFRKWLATELGIKPIKPDKIVKQAQAKLQKKFEAWVAQFVKG